MTSVAKALGASTYFALLAGSISYALSAVLGIVVSQRLTRLFRDDPFLVLVPPAFAVMGGTFVHLAQIAVAAPAVLLLGSYLSKRSPTRSFAIAALIVLAVPWSSVANAQPLSSAIWPHAAPPRSVVLPTFSGEALAEESETAFDRGGGYGSDGAPLVLNVAFKLPTWFALICFSTLAVRIAFQRAAPRLTSNRYIDLPRIS